MLGELPGGVRVGRQTFAEGARASRLVLYHEAPPDPDEVGSTTGVHLLQDDGRLELRIPRFSSPADTVLGLSTLEGVSAAVGAPIELADGTLIGGVDDRLVETIADEKATVEARLVRRAVDEDRVVGVAGYRRPTFIGRRVIGRFAARAPVEEAATLILGLIEAVQRLDEDFYRMPQPSLASPPGESAYTFVGCEEGASVLVPSVDYVALLGEGAPVYVTAQALAELEPTRFAFLDDRQAIFDARLGADAWAGLLDRARRVESRP